MPLSQSLHFSSRLPGSHSTRTTASRNVPDSRLPLLPTPNSQPVDRPRPASSLGFRSLFNSLGSQSSRQSKTSTVTRLKTPTPSTPRTPSFPPSHNDTTPPPSPLTRSPPRQSPSLPYQSRDNLLSPSARIDFGFQRVLNRTPEHRDPKWRNVEAEWKRQARYLNLSHRECLLGAVCIDIRDPLDDVTADNFRSYVKDRPIRRHAEPPSKRLQSPLELTPRPPSSPDSCTTPSTPSESTIRPLHSPRSRQMVDRPRPVKRRCNTPEPLRLPAHPLLDSHINDPFPEPRKRAHSMPLERRHPPAPAWHRQTRVVDAPESPWSIVAPPTDLEYGQSPDGDITLRDWTMLSDAVSRSPSLSDQSTMKARKSMLRKLESVLEWDWQVLPKIE